MKNHVLVLAFLIATLFVACVVPTTEQKSNHLMSDRPEKNMLSKEDSVTSYTFKLPPKSYKSLQNVILVKGTTNEFSTSEMYFFNPQTEKSNHALITEKPDMLKKENQSLKISGYCFDKKKGADKFAFFYEIWPNDSVLVNSDSRISKDRSREEIEKVNNMFLVE